jgi:hypothetical protein
MKRSNNVSSSSSPEDVHSQWLLNLITNLAQKVNTNIVIKQMPNGSGSLMLSNVGENDLDSLTFLTNTDANNNFGRVTGMGVSIAGQNGTAIPVKIYGFSSAIVKAYNDADSQAFLNNSKTFKPFVDPFTNPVTWAPMSVSEYVDQQTASNPSLPKTTGVPKTYSVAFSAKSNKKKNNNLAGSTASSFTNCTQKCMNHGGTSWYCFTHCI